MDDQIEMLQAQLRSFAKERDWDRFHNPKNLVMALTAEVGELVELFQWLRPEQADVIMGSPRSAARVREELADVFIYLLRLAEITGVDLAEAATEKLALNARKYPADKVRGSALRHDEYGDDSD